MTSFALKAHPTATDELSSLGAALSGREELIGERTVGVAHVYDGSALRADGFPETPIERPSDNSSGASDWVLWQLADSAFPTGGYAHSNGLEAAWHHGAVRNARELASFIEATLHQIGHSALPFVTAAHDQPERLVELDQLCDAFTSNHVANRASRAQGRAFLAAAARIFAPAGEGSGPIPSPPPCGHFAPVFGTTAPALGLPRETTVRLFLFGYLRGLLAAAVRLNIVGPMEGQRLQHRLAPKAETIMKTCARLDLEALAQTAPLLDLWQGAQDRLYSRLFQS